MATCDGRRDDRTTGQVPAPYYDNPTGPFWRWAFQSDRYARDEAIFARHLKEPIPGISAMDIGVFNEMRETENDENINAAFQVAERYRQALKAYTKADYERGIAGRDGQRD